MSIDGGANVTMNCEDFYATYCANATTTTSGTSELLCILMHSL